MRLLIGITFVISAMAFSSALSSWTNTSYINDWLKDKLKVIGDPAEEYNDELFYIDGQIAQHVRQILQSADSTLWIGTNVYGILKYKSDTLEYTRFTQDLKPGRITGIKEDCDGNIWFASATGIIRYDGDAYVVYDENEGLENSEVWSFLIDKNDNLWAGTTDGVYKMKEGVFKKFPIKKADINEPQVAYSPDRITSIMEDKEGNIWFGTDGFGITIYNGKTFKTYTTKDGLHDNSITDIIEDGRGSVWIGSMYGGLSQYANGTFINHTANGTICGEEVYGLHLDKHNNVWLSSEHHGVYKYDGNEFTNYHDEEGLNSGGIQTIYDDNNGRIWCGGWGGLFRLENDGRFKAMTKNISWK